MTWQWMSLSSALPTAALVTTVTGLTRCLSQSLLVTLIFSTGPNMFVSIGVSKRFKRKVKSHLQFAGVIRSSPYSPR